LLVITFRPEFKPPWIGLPHVTAITINRLARRDIDAIIDRLVGNKLLPPGIREDIIERTDGIPLFIEEMTKAVLEAESVEEAIRTTTAIASPRLEIPASLHASLMARLDRLGPAKEVAQIGAMIGREFSHAVLASVVRKTEAELGQALDRLIESGLLFRQGLPPHANYLFKHALVQDAAYGTLLRESRRVLHARIAQTLVDQFEDIAEASPELVAHHYSEAGMPGPATVYWQRAGENAIRRSAHQEAMGDLSAGLAQLARLPDTPDRARHELAMQRLLGQASFATRGYASPEASRAFSRARELSTAVGEDSSIFPILFGVWLFELTSGQHANAATTADEFLARADRMQDIGGLISGNLAVGISGVHVAKLAHAHTHFDRAIGFYRTTREAEDKHLTYDYGLELGATICAYAAWCSWLLGYPDQGLLLGDQALAIGETSQHGYTRIRGLYWNSVFHAFRREWPLVEARAASAIAFAQERGLAMVVAVGQIMHGAARAMLNPSDEAVAEMRAALAAYHATGARFQSTSHLILLAQALTACGRHGEGLSALREAEALVDETGERYLEAEIHRLQGNLLLARGGNDRAVEASYSKALEVSRAQGARLFELRAAVDLARLWSEHGDRSRAAEILAPIYGWFTEGFETADLKEARALLDALAQ